MTLITDRIAVLFIHAVRTVSFAVADQSPIGGVLVVQLAVFNVTIFVELGM